MSTDMMPEKGHNITLLMFLPKNAEAESDHERKPDKHKHKYVIPHNWSLIFKNVKVKKYKDRLRSYSRLKRCDNLMQ